MKSSKKLKIVMISIIIFIILLIITIVFVINNKKRKFEERSRIMGVYDQAQDSESHLKFTNISNLSLCTSDSARQVEIAKKFETIFEEEIPRIYNKIIKLDEKEIIAYYEENKDTLKNNLYNIEKEDFTKLSFKIKNMQSNLNNDYEICNFVKEENYVIVECKYKNGETIKFKLTKYQILTFIE